MNTNSFASKPDSTISTTMFLTNPTIEDDEYDRLMRRIKEIEAENPEIVSESSPTQHVGGYAINTFEKVTHEVQMGSLQDVFSKGRAV